MTRKPKVWFDLSYLSSLGDGPGELYYLDEAGQQVLSQLAEIVRWQTRWFDASGQPLQETPALAFELYEDFKVPLHLDDLVEAIRESSCCGRAGKLQEMQQPISTTAGAGDIYPAGRAEDKPQPVTTTLVDTATSNGSIDTGGNGVIEQNEWEAYMCWAAHFLFDTLLDMMRYFAMATTIFSAVLDVGVWVATYVARRLWVGPVDDAVLFALEEYYEWQKHASESLTRSLLDAEIANMEAVRDDVICCMAEASSSEAMATCLKDAISANMGAVASAFFVLGPWSSIAALIWNGLFQAHPATCDCVADPVGAGFAVDSGTDIYGSLSYPAQSPLEGINGQLYENVVYRMTGKLSGGRNNRIQWQLDPDRETAAPEDSLLVTLTVIGGAIDTSYGSFHDDGVVKSWSEFDGDFVLEGGSQLFNVAGTSGDFEIDVEVSVV